MATVSGSTVSIVAAGTTTITATQSGNNNYNAAAAVAQVLTVLSGKQNQTITFAAIADKTLGDAPFTLSATASSGLTIAFISSSDKITMAGGQVTLVKSGKATITASQAGNSSFNSATSVDQSFCINPATPAITMTQSNTESPVLTSSNTTGNQWFLNGAPLSGATNATYNATSAGVYTLQVTVETCKSSVSAPLPVIVTGDQNPFSRAEVKLYPNPTENQLYIKWPKSTGASYVSIYQMDGKTVEKITTTQNELEVATHQYASGQYLVVINTNEASHHLKFLKK